MSPRLASFKALLLWKKEGRYIFETLDRWDRNEAPSRLDFNFAKELTSGVVRNFGFFEAQKPFLAAKTSWKVKEKLLVYMALYQLFFMDKVPKYAVVKEMVDLAKKEGSFPFSRFLNALLRKDLALHTFKGNDPHSLAKQFSFPLKFTEDLLTDYPLDQALEILKALNTPPQVMGRKRPGLTFEKVQNIQELGKETYIQNPTQAHLFSRLTKEISPPSSILDLCAAPGGKTLLAHDLFNNARITCTDLKTDRLKSNMERYGVPAEVIEVNSLDYCPKDTFDLVICDLPCSNSGVFAKRPEARWRYLEESLCDLTKLQLALLEKGASLTSSQGYLLVMTCSFLKGENAPLVAFFEKDSRFKWIKGPIYHPPTLEGEEGGFGFILQRQAS